MTYGKWHRNSPSRFAPRYQHAADDGRGRKLFSEEGLGLLLPCSGTIAARAGYHGMDRGDQPKPSSTMKRRSSGLRSVAGQMPPLQLFLPVHSAPSHSFIGVGAA